MYSTQEDAKYDLKVCFLTLFRKPCQYGNILAESVCMLLTKKGFFCSRSSERIFILVFLWCKATNFRGINVDRLTSFVPRILLCFFFRGSSRPSPLPIDFRVSEKELVNQFYNFITRFSGDKASTCNSPIVTNHRRQAYSSECFHQTYSNHSVAFIFLNIMINNLSHSTRTLSERIAFAKLLQSLLHFRSFVNTFSTSSFSVQFCGNRSA